MQIITTANSNSTMENIQKRGRPKLEEISSLIKEGVQSKSPIRCRFCKRAFPREKSLQAHQRIHTGERPYRCTHPGCHKSFVQSGQLRTHQRLHTGEKPFRCNECKNRFTHANRRCPDHPSAGVRRDERALAAENNSGSGSPTYNTTHSSIISYSPATPTTPTTTTLRTTHQMSSSPSSPTTNHHYYDDLQSNHQHRHHNKKSAYLKTQHIKAAHQNTTTTRSALCNLNYLNSFWPRGDEITGALALIELSQCH